MGSGQSVGKFRSSHSRTTRSFARKTLEVGKKHDHWLYEGVIEILGRIGPPKANDAVPTLACFLEHGQEADVRRTAIQAIARFKLPQIGPVLAAVENATQDEDASVRDLAVQLLRRLGRR